MPLAAYGITKSELRRAMSRSRSYNHEYTFVSIKNPVGIKIIVFHRNQREQWETEFENHYWEIDGKLVDIRNESDEIVDFGSGLLGNISGLVKF